MRGTASVYVAVLAALASSWLSPRPKLRPGTEPGPGPALSPERKADTEALRALTKRFRSYRRIGSN